MRSIVLINEWTKKVIDIVGAANLITDPGDLETYSHDEFASEEYRQAPLAVVRPKTENEAASLVRLFGKYNIPITARGGGTGLSAACIPSEGGVVLSLERMNGVVDRDEENAFITVQAGMSLKHLYEEVEEMGLFFPPHPGDESAQIGGTVATNAGGARAVKYGTIKRFIQALQVVLADGTIVEVGGRTLKSSCGYDLLNLFVGSEGTLGIITRVTLSLMLKPGSIQTLVIPFDTIKQAVGSVPVLLSQGITPVAVEFLSNDVIRCSEALLNLNWPTHQGEASLLLILDGNEDDELLLEAERIAEIMDEQGAIDVFIAEHKDKQREILEIRSMLYEALRPGTVELFDICVPRSEIAGHVEYVQSLEDELKVPLPTFGHAADGNVHTHSMRLFITDGRLGSEIPGWQEKHIEVRTKLYEDAVHRGGVISGEHGIGLVKRDFFMQNIGKPNLAVMNSIKKAMDPQGILNPGKIFWTQ
jgi:glycolate oxidase